MLERIIDFSLHRRGLVVFAALLLAAAGIWSAFHVAIDAVPDITSPQVQINTPVAALAPDEIETLVTVPIERELAGLPGLVELRALSKFGLSQVTLTFADGTDLYRTRQLATERLAAAREQLPAGATPALAPISTGLGEIVYYTLDYRADAPGKPATRADQLRELRLIHDFQVRPALRATPGLAEVNAIGGYEKQLVVAPDPEKLLAAGVSFDQLAGVIRASTSNAGGGVLELGGEAVVVRADTRARSAADIAGLPVKFAGGTRPLTVADLAEVTIGSAVRTGAATADGEETVAGAAIMLAGENSRLVARAAVERLEGIRTRLPAGVQLRVVYDRSDLVHATIRTVATNLFEGAVLVAAVLFALLGHWRGALLVTLAIPLSFLFLLTGMAQAQLSANLMSLGAIDFGLIVDGAIVMVENVLRHLAERQRALGRELTAGERLAEVHTSAREVARPMFFGVLVITLVYVPILALTGIEGKMFRPMAVAVMLALGGALALALTLMPALCPWFLRGRLEERDGRLVRAAKAVYTPLLAAAFRLRWLVVAAAVLLFAGSAWLFTRLGAEFIPQLDEGAISIQMIRGNSVALGDSVELQRRSERLLRERFPEISHLFARIGTAEIATDPMGPNVADTYVFLKPRDQWRRLDSRPATKAELVELMRRELTATIPGQTYLFSQPIQLRFNEIMAGARADLSLKIQGDDFAVLERLAAAALEILRGIPGGGDVEFETPGRVPTLEITPKRAALAGLGLHADEINAVVATALGGEEAGALVAGDRRTEVVVRLPEHHRLNLAGLRDLPVTGAGGVQVPLSQVADITVTDRVGTLTREDARRRVAILINVRGRDTEGFVREAEAKLRAQLPFPDGYAFAFGGQFENLQAARARLAVVVPAALALIYALIYASFGNARQAALVFVCVPLAATGGVAALALRGLPFTISAGVGFIALSGIAVLNGIMLVSFINQLRTQGHTVRAAVTEGTLTRLRPKLMTALVASLGFVPMALSTGPGAEVQRPLATVVIGGVITSTFLTLVVLPVLYDWLETRVKPSNC
ncbi:efflux RND transporter permease subunit [Oleiharenicola lentus]|uniref:Efflux RND transporter permease subunit n=1 Tax=Oleiharenicola lentus TaxID=2508720 RepID=A0A4V1M6E6_9BACT|nr:CusA/CzcA family heavy metal efflux RND transporter [Oleiharenicola lentus]RXK55129.1 efflux RND transporter permease subunit [Oleiharenicola lentus]